MIVLNLLVGISDGVDVNGKVIVVPSSLNVFSTARLRDVPKLFVILNMTDSQGVHLQPAIFPLAKSEP